MKKLIFKLEDRVLFDAAGVADAIEAVANQSPAAENAASNDSSQSDKDVLKNAPPENPAANVQAAQDHVQPGEAADLDAEAEALVEGDITPGDHAGDLTDSFAADSDADDVDTDSDDVQAVDDHALDSDSVLADAADSDADDAASDIDDFIAGAEADSDVDADDVAFISAPAAAIDGAPDGGSDATGRELVIINSSVKDAQSILDSLGENTDVLFLESGTDALEAINDYLDAHDVKYDAIHIVSHGNAGYFVLNGEIIDAESVATDPASWANIGEHLTKDGDIMIYGCNVAGSADGQLLISEIANLTGADVAASVDSTGAHGDWDLEYSVGVIDSDALAAYGYNYDLTNQIVSAAAGGTDVEHSFAWALDNAASGDEITFTVDAEITGDISEYTLNKDLSFTASGSRTVTIKNATWVYSGGTLEVQDNIELQFVSSKVTVSNATWDFTGTKELPDFQKDPSVMQDIKPMFDSSSTLNIEQGGQVTFGDVYSAGKITVDGKSSLVFAGNTYGAFGTVNSDSAVVYQDSGYVFQGNYTDLTLAGSDMRIMYGDVKVSGLFTARGNNSVQVIVNAGASLTLNGLISDNSTTTYALLGNMTIATKDDLSVSVAGTVGILSGKLIADADNLTFGNYVGIYASTGHIEITGKRTEFAGGFSDAMGWYVINDYNTDKYAEGLHGTSTNSKAYQLSRDLKSSASLTTDVSGGINNYNGSVSIDTDGEVLFSGYSEVVVVNKFEIKKAARVTFNAMLAVAGGEFTASNQVGELNFFKDVYVSTQYRTERTTNFTIGAKNTNFYGNFNMYAVGPRNYQHDKDGKWTCYTDYYNGSDNKIYNEDPSGFEQANATFTGDNVLFSGMVSLSSGFSASVTFSNNAKAMTFDGNITNDGSRLKAGDGSTFSFYGHSRFNLGNNAAVNGEVKNIAQDISSQTGSVPYAYFTIGSDNQFNNTFSNSNSYSTVEITSGGNSFSGVFDNRGLIIVTAEPGAEVNVFSNLTNYNVAKFNSGKLSVNITNYGEFTVSSNCEGIDFTGFVNEATGNATISATTTILKAYFTDEPFTNKGSLTIAGKFTSEVDIVNSGEKAILNFNGDNSLVQGYVYNLTGASLIFNANMTLDRDLFNAGKLNITSGAAGMVFNNVTNQQGGQISVNGQSTFEKVTNEAEADFKVNSTGAGTKIGFLDNQAGATAAFAGSVVLTGAGVNNAGTLTISSPVTCEGKDTKVINSDKLFMKSGAGPADHDGKLDLDNSGYVEVTGTAHFGDVVNNKDAEIHLANALSLVCFDGTLTHNGTITGTGSVTFRGETEGNGTLVLTGSNSIVTYNASEKVEQSFYATDNGYEYNPKVVVKGKGEVQVSQSVKFNGGLTLDGGNLVIVDSLNLSNIDPDLIKLDSGTLTIKKDAELVSDGDLVFKKELGLMNYGTLRLRGADSDVDFKGTTDGNGVIAMEGGNITYSAEGDITQTLYDVTGSFGGLTLSGSGKVVANDLDLTGHTLTNKGADITVNDGVTLTLDNVVSESTDYTIEVLGSLAFGSGNATLGSIENSGTVDANVLEGMTVNVKGLTNNGKADLNSAGTLNIEGASSNSGTLTLTGSGIKFADTLTVTDKGIVKASAGEFSAVDNSGTFNVESETVKLGNFTNNGALNFNTDYTITGSNLTSTDLGGTVTVAEGNTLTIDSTNALEFTDTVKVAEGATLVVNSIGNYSTENGEYSITSGGVTIEKLVNDGQVTVINEKGGADEAVLWVKDVTNNGTISALKNGIILLTQEGTIFGKLVEKGGRIYLKGDAPELSIYLYVVGNQNVSDFEDGRDDLYTSDKYIFMVENNATLTVNTEDASGSKLNYNVDETGTLIFDVDCDVKGEVKSDGTITVNNGADVTFNGKTSGSGEMKATEAGKVTYAADGSNGFKGDYADLAVTGNNVTFDGVVNAGNVTVDGGATFDGKVTATGTLSGTGNVVFNSTAKADKAEMGEGSVTYNAGGTVINGTYGGLTLNGDYTADNVTVNGEADINGKVTSNDELVFNGKVSADGNASIESSGTVEYNGSGDIVNGSYNNLVIAGTNQTGGDITIEESGSFDYSDSNGLVINKFTNYADLTLDDDAIARFDNVVNNGVLDIANDGNSFGSVENNGDFTISGNSNDFDSVTNKSEFTITGFNNTIGTLNNTANTYIDGLASTGDVDSYNNTGMGVVYDHGVMWMVAGSNGTAFTFPSMYNINFSPLSMLLNDELRMAELDELYGTGEFTLRRRSGVEKFDANGDDLAAVLHSQVDYLKLEAAFDEAVLDGAELTDADYAAIMNNAEVFTEAADEAIGEMAAI